MLCYVLLHGMIRNDMTLYCIRLYYCMVFFLYDIVSYYITFTLSYYMIQSHCESFYSMVYVFYIAYSMLCIIYCIRSCMIFYSSPFYASILYQKQAAGESDTDCRGRRLRNCARKTAKASTSLVTREASPGTGLISEFPRIMCLV